MLQEISNVIKAFISNKNIVKFVTLVCYKNVTKLRGEL